MERNRVEHKESRVQNRELLIKKILDGRAREGGGGL